MLGTLALGLACFFVAPAILPAAPQQVNAGSGQAGAPATIERQAKNAEDTIIFPNDLLYIQVFDVEQMTHDYRVNGTGGVEFPLLPQPVPVAGLTPLQAAKAIAQKCIEAGVLSHPQISITVRESRLHSVAVMGAVRSPQIYPVFGPISLMDILTQAGGVTDDAASVVTITRGDAARRVRGEEAGGKGEANAPTAPAPVTINLRRLLATGDPSLNVEVYPGDRVTVQRAGVVYVLGAVNHAGGYVLSDARQDMTILKAVALAGSLSPFAKAKNALLLRPNPAAPKGHDEIPIDLHAMLRGHIADRPLAANDILFVPDSTMLKALHRGADIAATTAAWTTIYAAGY
jgi:polysaccharide export outer membrane protein